MTNVHDIDELLASAWTVDNLQVYGDHLQELGDPRGELVAIDLHIALEGSSPQLRHRRRRALRQWLGLAEVVDPTRGPWSTAQFGYGFVIDAQLAVLSKLLSGPAAPFVRGVTMNGKTPAVDSGLKELARTVRPWLTRLTIAPRFRGDPPGRVWRGELPNLTLPPTLIAATPRLEMLELAGHRLIAELPHPNVKRLRVAGVDALQALLEPRTPMPAVTELAFAFAHEPAAPVVLQKPWPPLVPSASLPALDRLDLSPNEDQRSTTDTQISAFDVLPSFGVLDQLRTLRLPSIRNEHESFLVQRSLDRMPELRRLEVVRSCHQPPRHPRAEIVIVPVPWPRIEWARGALAFRFSPDRQRCQVGMLEAVRFCERMFDHFDDAARTAWAALWEVLADIGDDERSFSHVLLVRALDALGHIDGNRTGMRPWVLLRDRAHQASPDSEITVTRVAVY